MRFKQLNILKRLLTPLLDLLLGSAFSTSLFSLHPLTTTTYYIP